MSAMHSHSYLGVKNKQNNNKDLPPPPPPSFEVGWKCVWGGGGSLSRLFVWGGVCGYEGMQTVCVCVCVCVHVKCNCVYFSSFYLLEGY